MFFLMTGYPFDYTILDMNKFFQQISQFSGADTRISTWMCCDFPHDSAVIFAQFRCDFPHDSTRKTSRQEFRTGSCRNGEIQQVGMYIAMYNAFM